MRSERHSQRDLFEERATVPHLRPELRAKLTSLLQILLTEAAGVGQQDKTTRSGPPGGGGDQNHALTPGPQRLYLCSPVDGRSGSQPSREPPSAVRPRL